MISDQDRRVVALWAAHGIPRDGRTLDNAPIVLDALVRSHDEAWRVVDEVLARTCRCQHPPAVGEPQQSLFDGDAA